jgi:hypothetical protein
MYSTEVSLFINIIPENTDPFAPSRSRNRDFAFAAKHYQPFQLLYFRGKVISLVCHLFHVTPIPTKQQRACLTQTLQAKKSYLLNVPRNSV